MAEQVRLVGKQLVQAAIQRRGLSYPEILVEQIAHGTLVKPVPVKTPLAARVDEPIADQRLEDIDPAGPFAAGQKFLLPKTVETQLIPQFKTQPTCAPLPRASDADCIDSNLDRLARKPRRSPV